MYINVVNAIKAAAVAANPNGTFYHGRVSDAALIVGEKPMPQIHLYPFKSDLTDNNTSVSRATILMAFIGKDSPDSNDEDRTLIAQEMYALAMDFIDKMGDAQGISYSIEPFFKQIGTHSGQFLRFQLTSKYNPCAVTPCQ